MYYNSPSIRNTVSSVYRKKSELVKEKLVSDLEKFFKEYSVKETGSGLLISTKL